MTPEQKVIAMRGLERIDKYVQAALTGLLANCAYNSPESQAYLNAKKMTLEQIAVASALETITALDTNLKVQEPDDNQLKLIKE